MKAHDGRYLSSKNRSLLSFNFFPSSSSSSLRKVTENPNDTEKFEIVQGPNESSVYIMGVIDCRYLWVNEHGKVDMSSNQIEEHDHNNEDGDRHRRRRRRDGGRMEFQIFEGRSGMKNFGGTSVTNVYEICNVEYGLRLHVDNKGNVRAVKNDQDRELFQVIVV